VASPSFDYLFSLEQFGIKFGLENIRALVDELGHPERAFVAVHVAGTNGKGSVTAMVDAALQAAGYRSARYTSPHLVHLTERFVIDGRPVEPEALVEAVASVRDAAARLTARGRLETHPTFFEATTAAAFELFRRRQVDIAVCEVGLGGRLDATNVVSPAVTAITSIALDHQQYLGTTLADIAYEKAGIIKPGVPVVVGNLDAGAGAVIERVARERGAGVVGAFDGAGANRVRSNPGGSQTMRLVTPRCDYGEVELALAGAHQLHNAVIAVRVLEELDRRGVAVPPAAVVTALATVRWPGRLERVVVNEERELLLDAAHNPAGAAALAAFLGDHGDKRPLVFAAMRDKDAEGMLRALVPTVSALVLTRAANARSTDPLVLAALARAIAPDLPSTVADTAGAALSSAWRMAPRIVVAGSIFLLGDVMMELEHS
jgi:dihydrofolate synthase/folylpolyglutamate synthase